MLPPTLLEDSPKTSPRIHQSGDESENDLQYHGSENNFPIFGGDTIIPDDKFGPDEERIFIDDGPFDLDEAFFAMHHEEPPKINEDTTRKNKSQNPKNKNHQTKNRHANHHSNTEQSMDYVEESLKNAKIHEKGVADNYLRNQRGTDREDYEEEMKERISEESSRFEYPEKKLEKKEHSDNSTRDIRDHSTDLPLQEKSEENSSDRSQVMSTDAASPIIEEVTTTGSLVETAKKEGFKTELTLENVEDDESYDGELSREKTTIHDLVTKNDTDSVENPWEDRKIIEAKVDEGWLDALVNETTKEDTSGGAEITKDDDGLEDDDNSELVIVHSHVSSKDRHSSVSTVTVESLPFEKSGLLNETSKLGAIKVFSRGTFDFIAGWILIVKNWKNSFTTLYTNADGLWLINCLNWIFFRNRRRFNLRVGHDRLVQVFSNLRWRRISDERSSMYSTTNKTSYQCDANNTSHCHRGFAMRGRRISRTAESSTLRSWKMPTMVHRRVEALREISLLRLEDR